MNYTKHAAVAELLLEELGDPPVVAVTLWNYYVEVQIATPIDGVDWKHRVGENGDHWSASLEREGVRVELCAFQRKAMAA